MSAQLATTKVSKKSSVLDQVKVVDSKRPKKIATEDKDPKLAPVVNFLNGACTRRLTDKSKPLNTLQNTTKSITFKELDKLKAANKAKKSEKLVIDLKNFSGLEEIRTAYEIAAKANDKIENAEDKIKTDGVTRAVYDPITRGYLSMSETKFVEKKHRVSKKPKAKKAKQENTEEEQAEEAVEQPTEEVAENEEEQIVSDHLDRAIATLGLPQVRTYAIQDFIDAIAKVVNNFKVFRIKAFNKSFPLDVHDKTKDSGHINSKYVQHYLHFFNETIQFIVENIDQPDLAYKALEHVHGLICKKFKEEHKSPDELTLRIQIESFLERFKDNHAKLISWLQGFVAHKKGFNDDLNELTIRDEIRNLPIVVKKGNELKPGNDKIGEKKLDKDLLKLLARLRKYYLFINIILDGKQHLETTSGSDVDYDEYYETYQSLCNTHTKFVKDHSEIEPTIAGLLTYLVQSIVFISKFRNNLDADKKLIYITASEFNDDGVIFKLDVKLARKLRKLYTETDERIAIKIQDLLSKEFETFADDLSAVGSIQTFKNTAVDNANIFAKIGNIVNTIPGIGVDKNTRIAAGLALVKYIIIETNRIIALESNKKSALTIYLKL